MSESNSNNKRIAKNSLLLYFRMLFIMLISLYTSRVILNVLGVTDYGIYNVVGGFVSLFSLISASLTSASSRFLNYEMGLGNKQNLRTTFSTIIVIQISLAILIGILCETIGIWYINNIMVLPYDRLAAANWCFQISILTFCFSLIMVPYNAAIVAHEKMSIYAYISIFDGIAKLLICLVIIYSSYDKLVFYAFLVLVVQLIDQVLYWYYCRKKFEECRYRFIIDVPLIKKMASYALWHIMGNSSAILKNQGIDMLLNVFFGPIVNAAKAISTRVLAAVQGFASNFMMAINPQITQSYAKKQYEYCYSLVFRGAKFSFFILFLISLPVIINTEYILEIWLIDVPKYSTIFVQLSMVLSLMSTWSGTLITLNNATGIVRNYQLVVGGIQMLTFPFAYVILMVGFPPYSTLIVAIIVECFCLLARLIMLRPCTYGFRPFYYFKEVVWICLLVTVTSSIIPVLLKLCMPQGSFSFFFVSFFSLIWSGFMIFTIGCNKSERDVLLCSLTKLKNKLIK